MKYKNLQEKIENINLSKKLKNKYSKNNIEFLGLIPNKESLKIIENSIAVITATKLYEGQPMLLCEASSLGVPSIFPNFGGISEFFPENNKLAFEQFNYAACCIAKDAGIGL